MKKRILIKASALLGLSSLPGEWSTPVVKSIILPAHAVTSLCETLDYVGRWEFVSEPFTIPAYQPYIDLYEDGSTSDYNSIWYVIDGVFVLTQDLSDYRFWTYVTSNCNQLSGQASSVFYDPPNGTWSATKIN